ncbi:MAG: HlyC/CorC family transporter [Verrucomicrobiales bacterium]|nr:HlyC/CorC family transporter [Verrucomicrobiales bacterium]
MSAMTLEIAVIFALLLANGLFAMSEIAVVSARKARLRQRAEAGNSRARAALELAENPNRFLATVQVGITLVGTLAAAFGGARVAGSLAGFLTQVPWLEPYAQPLSFGLVVAAITLASLIIGELVPKRLGLANPEGIAAFIAGPLGALSRIVSPLVTLLGWGTDAVLKLFRIEAKPVVEVTEEEVGLLVREGMRAGVFHPSEPAMVEGVLALDRLTLGELMTPRAKIIWVNVHEPHDAIWHKIVVSGHTTYPVYDGNLDHVVGVVTVNAIYANLAAGIPPRVKDLMTPPLVVPATQSASALLETFKRTGKHIALAADEFGGIVGLVSLHDIMEAIIGELPSPDERLKPRAKRREDGSVLVDAIIELDEFARAVPDFQLPPAAGRHYQTFAGFIMQQLGRVPAEGEAFDWSGYRVEVIDMDGHRVDKVLLMRQP